VRIAQVIAPCHPQIGGAETHVRRLASSCFGAGDEVIMLTHQAGGPAADEWMLL
jgi:hypothetical protein